MLLSPDIDVVPFDTSLGEALSAKRFGKKPRHTAISTAIISAIIMGFIRAVSLLPPR